MGLVKTALVALSLCNGIQAASVTTAPSLTQRQDLNGISCSQVRIIGFTDPGCSVSLARPMTATIGDSAGFIVPLVWTSNGPTDASIQSVQYLEPITKNVTACCDPIQFQFYNSQAQFATVAYFTPGQQGHGCVDFYNITVEGYRGVKMLAGLPEGFVGVGQ